jgi:hypothetical protein
LAATAAVATVVSLSACDLSAMMQANQPPTGHSQDNNLSGGNPGGAGTGANPGTSINRGGNTNNNQGDANNEGGVNRGGNANNNQGDANNAATGGSTGAGTAGTGTGTGTTGTAGTAGGTAGTTGGTAGTTGGTTTPVVNPNPAASTNPTDAGAAMAGLAGGGGTG